MAEAPGSRLGPLRIVGPVGTGGFATVYRARDDRLDTDVAVKVLAENHCLDPDVRGRFLREGRLLRKVASAHVVAVYDIGETDRLQPYLVLELAAGGDLRGRVERLWAAGHPVLPDDVAEVATALADALEAVHVHGVVHRDVSPGNLLIVDGPSGAGPPAGRLLAPDERLVLADLGLAKDLRQHSGITVAGGTEGFSPPGRGDARPPDPRDDVYAASAVLTWLVTGSTPDRLDGAPGAVLRRAGARPGLADALGRGLDARPERRQPDAATWRAAVLSGLGAGGPAAVPPGPALPRDRRRPLWRTVGAAVVLVAAVVAGLLLLGGGGDGTSRTDLGDGVVRTQRGADGVQVAVFGPDVATVGQVATFEAGVDGGVDFAWIDPDGVVVTAAEQLEVTPTEPGTATVTLFATTASGEVVSVEHRVEVGAG